MKFQSLLRGAVLGAGAAIFAVGLALAQTPPAPAAPAVTPPAATSPAATPDKAAPTGAERRDARRKMREECREKSRDLRGSERRDSMQKCMSEGRAGMGMQSRSERRESMKKVREACRAELKDQRFTEDERRKAMQDCAVKKDPSLAKGFKCRDEAEAKKLERGSREFRSFMRECHMGR
jgi:hypothetical protein